MKKIIFLSFTLFRGVGGGGLDQKCESSHFFFSSEKVPYPKIFTHFKSINQNLFLINMHTNSVSELLIMLVGKEKLKLKKSEQVDFSPSSKFNFVGSNCKSI